MSRTILVVDDVRSNRLILKELLHRDYRVLEAVNGEEALDVLTREHETISAVLLDIGMPGIDGYEVLRRIRSDKKLSPMPVIMITGSNDEASRVNALSLGANDYVMKPYSAEIIKHCLRNNIALREASDTVSILERDRLTGIWNRDAFFERTAQLIEEAPAGSFVLGCIDIEGFKVINDQYGSDTGDAMLKALAEAMQSSCAERGGICGRISADQFVSLFPVALLENDSVGPELLEAGVLERTGLHLTLSVGRYIIDDKSLSTNAIYDRAAIAKSTIKGRYDTHVAVFDESMREKILHERSIVNEMHAALEAHQFVVWFQPQYNRATNAMIGSEALVRWLHPQKGLIPPNDFIPIFEQNGFIYDMDKYVWEEVCRYLRKWLDEGRSPLPVSVNISRYDILRSDLIATLTGLVSKYELPCDLLRLEVTESAFSQSANLIVKVVRELIALGFTIEIDDFGSGYSSLNTLKDVPAQIIKLDMRFLESSEDSQRGGSIVESVVRMAKWLGVSVIAEGVEDAEQADYLRSIGCYYMQGYLYARPMTSAQYEEHCSGVVKEERLLSLETVENLDNNAFWDPKSMDTLIFNSYVGAACIFEYIGGKIEVVRSTERFAEMIGGAAMSVEDTLKLDWNAHLDDSSRERLRSAIERSKEINADVTTEVAFISLPGCPERTHIRATIRVIAVTGNRCLIYNLVENITERREAQREAQEAARLIQTMMDDAPGGFALMRLMPEGNFATLYVNDGLCRMRKMTREQLMEAEGADALANAHPDDVPGMLSTVQNAMNTGNTCRLQYRLRGGDGEYAWFSVFARMTHGDNGEALIHIYYAELTEPEKKDLTLRETEQKERETAQRLQAIMDNAGTGIRAMIMTGDSVDYLFTNDRFFELQGYTRQQYHAEVTDSYSVIHPDDRAFAKEKIQSTIHVGDNERAEFRIVTRNGETRWLRAVITVTSFEGVESPVQLCVYTDVTEIKENELRIRKLSDSAQTLMNDTPGGFCRMAIHQNAAPTLLYLNEGFARMLGMTPDEVMAAYGENMYLCMNAEDFTAASAETAAAFASGGSFSVRCRLRRADGEYIRTRVVGRFVTSETGEPVLNSYFSDITADISEQERQRQLLDNLPYGAALFEYDGSGLTVVHLNKKYWELVEHEPNSSGTLSISDAIHPDDRALMMDEIKTAIRGKRSTSVDLHIRCKETEYRPFHVLANVEPKDGGGYLIYAAFEPIDIDALSYQQALPLLLSAVMNATNDFAFAKDKDFRYISASPAFLRIAGLDNEREALGKTDFDLFPADMAEQFRKNDITLIESEKPLVDFDETIYAPDGTTHYCRASKYPLHDAGGHIIGIYGVSRDITNERSALEQLRLVNDSVPGGLATYSVKNGEIRISYCNSGFCGLFGGTLEGFRRRGEFDPIKWVHKDDVPLLLAQIDALVESNTPIDCVYRVKTLDNGYKWISQKAVATERRGDTVFFNAMLLDVNERQLINEQLRISEEENNLAVQHSGSLVCRYDVAEKTLTMSAFSAAKIHLPAVLTDVPYTPVKQGLISPETADAYIGFFEAILKGNKAGTVLFQQRYLGKWQWEEAKSSTVFADDGTPVKAVISMSNVTDRIEKENIYKKWQQSLADRAPESYTLFRTNISHRSDYDAREGLLLSFDFDRAGADAGEVARAYAAQCVYDKDMDKYIAFVNADTMLANYYRGKRSDFIEYRELTANGNMRWLRLTVDLVEYPNTTDVEAYMMYEDVDAAKKAELQTKELSETDPLTGILNRMTFTAKMDRILQSSRPDAKHALLMLDIDGFKQVNDVFGHGAGDQTLIDLANGLRSIMRHEDLVARLGGDEFVVFLNGIQNENAAINKAKQIRSLARRAFSMEVQISASVGIAFFPFDGASFEALYKKADSALYYVKGSGKDDQAVYNESMANEHLEPEPNTVTSGGARPAEKKRRMLIVDDSSIDHTLMQNIFRDEFIIESAKDGNTALIRLRHYGAAISVMLLDLMMPGMDGFAVLEKMQESAELRSIPVIIVSGDESRETCLTAIRKGATDFITKPIDAAVLSIRVHSAVSRAENERLRAKNSLLEVQGQEQRRYEALLESPGITFIEYNWLSGDFTYYPSISQCLRGTYDGRKLWQILLSDMVADTFTVQDLQQLVHRVAESREETSGTRIARLKTPQDKIHRFRVHVRKLVNEYQLANRIIITLTDLEYGC